MNNKNLDTIYIKDLTISCIIGVFENERIEKQPVIINIALSIDTTKAGKTDNLEDTAEGKLEEGGIEGEGQFHLVRPGGESQNVYLTSSLVDLSQFVGRKIKVWGETQKAQHAGWLMDVGRVEVL